ncbi:MAG: class I SAM-dependent methyltransferase [Promethearchaeota archaeon]
MDWNDREILMLGPILDKIWRGLNPTEGKKILVLCCGSGEMVFWLREKADDRVEILGLDLRKDLLQKAKDYAKKRGIEDLIEFSVAERYSIPSPDEEFDGLISEFVVYPTPEPTEIGQKEMARVLKGGGRMILTDIITTKPIPDEVLADLKTIGLNYLCEATRDDFRTWMRDAGLENVVIEDLTPIVKEVWKQRQIEDSSPGRRNGYRMLIDSEEFGLGRAIFYIYVQGEKPVGIR